MARNINNNERLTFKADLHIHTPASKCYKGPKDDVEYLRIIENAKEKGLDIIAITDHNSIEGYEKLIEQKIRIKTEIEAYKKLKDSKEAKQTIKEDERILAIFDSILILPGVEIEVNHGVHMLAIFNPETEITIIKEFLKNGGFDDESIGKDDVFSDWSLFSFYEESKNYDCLIFDAHTDSNKGIFNTISEGTTRIHAFTDKALAGIFYKNEKRKNKIRALFSQPNYRRTNPVAFLKSSDAHKIEDIGKEKTYFLLNDLKWTDFKDSFNNPDECIFTADPDTKAIINSVSNTGKCVFISDIENTIDKFAESLCGLSNSDGGYIVLGAESTDVINGIEIRNKNDNKRIDDFFDVIHKKTKINFGYNRYPVKDGFYVLVVRVDSGDELVDVGDNGVVYYYTNGAIKNLSANQIHQLLCQKIETKYQQHISKELAVITKSASAIDTYLKSQPILNSYSKKSITIYQYISSLVVQEPTKLTPEQKQRILDHYKEKQHGSCRGSVMFIDKDLINPRLNDAFLRITPPKFLIQGIKKISNKNILYIIPGGAVFYSESELNYHNNRNIPVLKIEVSDEYPIKFLCAFLKSSFFLWYVKNKFGEFNFFPSTIFNEITIPILHLGNQEEKELISGIETNVDNIVNLENTFLRTDWKTIKNRNEYVTQHNEKTKIFFNKIDASIFSLLRLEDKDIKIIKDNLRANYIYVPE